MQDPRQGGGPQLYNLLGYALYQDARIAEAERVLSDAIQRFQFSAVLQEAAPTGVRDADPAFWITRLDGLRLTNRADQFDEAAIHTIHGYCQRALGDAPLSAGLPLQQRASDALPRQAERALAGQD